MGLRIDQRASMPAQGKILLHLTEKVNALASQEPIRTKEFCEACQALEPFFDNLVAHHWDSPHFVRWYPSQAPSSTLQKLSWCTRYGVRCRDRVAHSHRPRIQRETVVAVQHQHLTLPAVFAAERAVRVMVDSMSTLHQPTPQAGRHTQKHSPARNLHRLAITLEFMVHVFDYLIHDSEVALRVAVSQAYDLTLGPIHYWAVRTAVKAGLYSLPTRECFFQAIGETVDSGCSGGKDLVMVAKPIVQKLHGIFDGIEMPCSDVKWLPSFSDTTAQPAKT